MNSMDKVGGERERRVERVQLVPSLTSGLPQRLS